jgi:hypothetical protein
LWSFTNTTVAASNGCPVYGDTCASAASGGYLDMLQWAHTNGFPWDSDTCASAAEYGHSNILQCARANGWPWDVTEMLHIIDSSDCDPEIVNWVQLHIDTEVNVTHHA